jgi:hypothetical protein
MPNHPIKRSPRKDGRQDGALLIVRLRHELRRRWRSTACGTTENNGEGRTEYGAPVIRGAGLDGVGIEARRKGGGA